MRKLLGLGLLGLGLALVGAAHAADSQKVDTPQNSTIYGSKNRNGDTVTMLGSASGFAVHMAYTGGSRTINIEGRRVKNADGLVINELVFTKNFTTQHSDPAQPNQTGCPLHQQAAYVSTGSINFVGEISTAGGKGGTYQFRIQTQDENGEWISRTYDNQQYYPPSGDVRIVVRDKDKPGSPTVGGVLVKVIGPAAEVGTIPDGNTDSSGAVRLQNLIAGTAYQVQFSKSGFTTGSAYLQAKPDKYAAESPLYLVSLSATSAPSVDGGSGTGEGEGEGGSFPLSKDWWIDLVRTLFVPQEATLTAWTSFMDQMKSWGPFGLVKQFQDVWNVAERSCGEGDLSCAPIIDLSFQPFGPGQGVLGGILDLRRMGANGETYPDGGTGSPFGNMLGYVRDLAGWAVYGGFMFLVIKRMTPQVNT